MRPLPRSAILFVNAMSRSGADVFDEACDKLTANGTRKRIDVGKIGTDYFANAAAIGLSPMIADSVPHALKRYLGMVGYLIWATRCAVKFKPFRLTVDDGKSRQSVSAIEVAAPRRGQFDPA